jgi:hypothetical protein
MVGHLRRSRVSVAPSRASARRPLDVSAAAHPRSRHDPDERAGGFDVRRDRGGGPVCGRVHRHAAGPSGPSCAAGRPQHVPQRPAAVHPPGVATRDRGAAPVGAARRGRRLRVPGPDDGRPRRRPVHRDRLHAGRRRHPGGVRAAARRPRRDPGGGGGRRGCGAVGGLHRRRAADGRRHRREDACPGHPRPSPRGADRQRDGDDRGRRRRHALARGGGGRGADVPRAAGPTGHLLHLLERAPEPRADALPAPVPLGGHDAHPRRPHDGGRQLGHRRLQRRAARHRR